MTRRRRLALLALALALFGVLALLALPFASRRGVERTLSRSLGRPVTVADVRYHLLPFVVEILGLHVEGIGPGEPPSLEVARVEIVPSLASLLGPRLVLARLRIEGLRLRIHAFPQGGDDIPRPRGGGGGGRGLRIRRLVIADSELVVDHERVPLDLDLPDFGGRMAARRRGVLAGHLSFGPGHLQFGSAPPMTLGTEMDITAEGPLITVESGTVRGPKIALTYTGQIRIAKDPVGEFELTGPADLGELDRHVFRTGFGMEGASRFRGTLSVDGPRIRIKGHLDGTAGLFDGVPVPRYSGEVAKDERGTHIRSLEVETLDGGARLDIEIPPAPSIARLDARMRAVDAEGLVQAIFDIGAPGVGGAATGEVSIRWPRGQFRRLSGTIAADLEPRADGRRPLSGRFEWRAEAGVQQIERADLHTPTTWTRLAGRIELDDRADMTLDAESRDLADTDDLVMHLRRALGTPDAQRAGFSGSGVFRGRWRGTLHVPIFEGRFSGQEVGYLGVTWGRAEWAGSADPDEVRSHSLVLRRPGGELWLDGRTETGLLGEHDGIDVHVRVGDWPVADFIKALDWDLDMTGLLTGEARITGRRSVPLGGARLRCRDGRYYGVPYADLELTSVLRGAVTEVAEAQAHVGGGLVRFRGTASDDGVYDGRVELAAVDVGEVLPPVAPEARWGGSVSGELQFQGTLARPRLRGHLSSPRLFLADEGVGALTAELSASGDGSVTIASECRSARVRLAASGRVGARPPHEAALRISAQDTSLDPFLRVLVPALPTQAGLLASGDLVVRGPLLEPSRVHVDADVTRLELLLPEYPVRNPEPLHVAVDGGRVVLPAFHVAGEGTDLVVDGSAALLEDGPLDLHLKGEADLRALAGLTRRLRGQGAARLTVEVSGRRSAPAVDGRLDLEGAGLRVRGFPHGLEDVRGSVMFSETAASFQDVTGTLGGGGVELDGHATYKGGRLTSFDAHGSGRGLALRYPEGLRSVIDADLRCFGDAEHQWVTGTVDVGQALWTRRYELASELLSGGHAWAEEASLAEGVRYDLRIRAPGSFRVDNNLATLQATADLTLQGSYDAPVVLGRAEIDRGRVYFQGNTYVIRRGTIDFANPQRIDPFFDIEAETRIRSYRVTLKLNGTLERVSPTLTSDPPLTAVQILTLLAGADETTVTSLSTVQADQARLAATGAATLAAGKISEEVGLERGAERLFGLNRFSIDPSVVKGGLTNPTARLTVGKRLTPDLNVLYSVDLRGTEERLLSVEYTLSDRLSLLLTREEPGGFGFDLRLRRAY